MDFAYTPIDNETRVRYFPAEVRTFSVIVFAMTNRVRRSIVFSMWMYGRQADMDNILFEGQFDVREERASLAFNLYWLDFRLKCDHVSKIRFVINDPVALHLFAWFTVKIYIQFRIASNRYGIQCAIKLKYFMLRITSSKLDGKKLEINTSCRKNLLWVCEKFLECGNCLLS